MAPERGCVSKLHRDEAEVDDTFFAAYVDYNGFRVMKCSTLERDRTVWTFLVPSCDIEIMREEFENDQPIQVKSYRDAFKRVQNFQSLSRKNCGEYLTREWKEAIGI
jgi:hypothetical protein